MTIDDGFCEHCVAGYVDFARRTGANINLHTQTPNQFKGRTVTVASPGPVPFWDALDLFCRKADLHETAQRLTVLFTGGVREKSA